jgi:hypothetical protein
MIKIKKIIWGFLIIALLGLMTLGSGCDHTELEGTIHPSPVKVKVGESITLTLEVPPELEGIHKEMWDVDPDSLGVIDYGDCEENCRQVTFTATSPGKGGIGLCGFYKQTNPQPITDVEVIVEE